MKTLLPLFIIILVTAISAAGIFTLIENTNIVSSSMPEDRQPPSTTNADGQTQTMPEREHGEGEEGSLLGGIGGVLITLAKITGITLIVTLIEKAISRPRNVVVPPASA